MAGNSSLCETSSATELRVGPRSRSSSARLRAGRSTSLSARRLRWCRPGQGRDTQSAGKATQFEKESGRWRTKS